MAYIAKPEYREPAAATALEAPQAQPRSEVVQDRPAAGRGWRTRMADVYLPLGVTFIAVLLWAFGLPSVDLRDLNDLGLVSVLPPPVVVGFGLSVVSSAWSLTRPTVRPPVLLIQLVTLIVLLYAMPPLVEPVPALKTAWRHAGIVDYISQRESVDPSIDAYFNWPSFFILLTLVMQSAGIDSVMALSEWAPLFFNLLYLIPLCLLYRPLADDARAMWMALFVFYLANWVGQDYLAPQALAYFYYLMILVMMCRWLAPRMDGRGTGAPTAAEPSTSEQPGQDTSGLATTRRQRVIAVVAIVAAFAAAVPSHQLTPFAMVSSVMALVLFRRCVARALPVLMLVLLSSWLVFMTVSYQAGHFGTLVGSIGKLSDLFHANVGNRLGGTPEHLLVVRTRMLIAGGLWTAAGLGWLIRHRKRVGDSRLALLAAAPFPLFVLQPYGGEMLLRVYLLALPLVALLAVVLLFRLRGLPPRVRSFPIVAVALVALLGAFLVARYGNERLDYFTAEEVLAVERMYERAAPGDVLIAAVDNLPWKHRGYGDYAYVTLDGIDPEGEAVTLVDGAFDRAREREGDAFFLITRSQLAFDEVLGALPTGTLRRMENRLREEARLVYENRDARLYRLLPPDRGAPQ